jgi:hypothetical protein
MTGSLFSTLDENVKLTPEDEGSPGASVEKGSSEQ